MTSQYGLLAGSLGTALLVALMVWVLRPAFRGPEAARRDLGTWRLAVGGLVVAVALALVLSAPVVLLIGPGGGMTVPAFLASIAATELPMLGLVYVRVVRPRALAWRDLGLRWLPPEVAVPTGLLVGFASLMLSEVVGLALQHFGFQSNQLNEFDFSRNSGRLAEVLILLSGSVAAPMVEEIFFRGFLFGLLARRHPKWQAYVGSSALFAVLHVQWGSMDVSQAAALVISIFVLGTILAWTYDQTGSLIPGMIAHAMNNAVTLLLFYSGIAG